MTPTAPNPTALFDALEDYGAQVPCPVTEQAMVKLGWLKDGRLTARGREVRGNIAAARVRLAAEQRLKDKILMRQ